MTVNTVLICGWLSSVISPPICIARFLAIVSPRPFPCIWLLRESSIVNSRSNTVSAYSGLIPRPLSVISIYTFVLSVLRLTPRYFRQRRIGLHWRSG